MSFSTDVKEEICRQKLERKCCALAESFGVLLFCHTFSPDTIRISTTNAPFMARLPKLFKKAFGLTFDVLPPEAASGRRSLLISDRQKISAVYSAFGWDASTAVSHHVNYAVLEEECCRIAFLRGAFLAGGSVTDPDLRFHLELATVHHSVARECVSLMQELGFQPRLSERSGNTLLYFKQSDAIADLLTIIGAPVTSMRVMTAKVDKEMRNTVTRRSHEHGNGDHHPHRILYLHREKEEQEQATFREEPVVSDKYPHQGAARTDNRIVGQAKEAHGDAENRSDNAAEHVHPGKMLRAHPLSDLVAEHPEHQHVEQEMPEVHMHKHVGKVTPDLERARREKRPEEGNIIAEAAIPRSRDIQVEPHNSANQEGQQEHDQVRNQQYADWLG